MNGPDGFRYQAALITVAEEAELLERIAAIEFSNFEMRGVIARRRVAFFGAAYDRRRTTAPPLPDFLLPLRQRIGEWTGVDPRDFSMALVNEYRPGAPIGWHRDAPQYGIVAGVSLLTPCTMKLRPYVSPAAGATVAGRRQVATHDIRLEPRSVYLLSGEARTGYEHHIPAVAALRYSITFRTLRARTSR
jgi:alkylated DNA repair dioxygenase AlkB